MNAYRCMLILTLFGLIMIGCQCGDDQSRDYPKWRSPKYPVVIYTSENPDRVDRNEIELFLHNSFPIRPVTETQPTTQTTTRLDPDMKNAE